MWLIIGLVAGAAILGFFMWMRSRNISMKWYEWIIAIVGVALLLFTIQNFFDGFAEGEPTAAWMFLLITGLPAVILLAVSWQLLARHSKA